MDEATEDRVLRAVSESGSTLASIVEKVRISRTRVTAILQTLHTRGKVEPFGPERAPGWRRPRVP